MNRKYDMIATIFCGFMLVVISALLFFVVIKLIDEPNLHNFLILVSLAINGGLTSFFFISLINDMKKYPHYI